jgi:hypothetical protein
MKERRRVLGPGRKENPEIRKLKSEVGVKYF